MLDLGRDAAGKRIRKWHSGYPTRKLAEKARTAFLTELDTGRYVEPSALTVAEFVTKTWLPGLEAGGLRPTTVAMYRRSAERYLLPHLGAVRLRDLSPLRLREWLDELRAAGIGDRTVEVAGVTVHKLLKSAVDLELISRNPADNAAVRAARPKHKAKAPTVWTAAETRAFLDSQRDDRTYPLWRLAIMTGLRRGELAGLRWRDVDLDGGVLHVRGTRVTVGYQVVESSPKTEKGKRAVGLDPATVAALRACRVRQTEEMFAYGKARSDDGLVFVHEDGSPYHPQRFTTLLAERAKAAGLPVIKLHALRHGHATAALEAGVPMKVVSERLGHSGIAITSDIYSHVTAATDLAAAAQVAATIDGSK
ncbi:MAG TPA: tyrosine-type recombinase/integrase [Acidimicrobiales bacterium]|nr:tyrosine-type recombinase/integrase [Acidimicrobiales bacterium]